MAAVVERTGLSVVLGVLGGGLLGWATLALSTTDIGGPGWSLRGNGALIVEFAVGPTLLAGGWLALVRQGMLPALLAAGLVLAIELGVGFAPILVGPGSPAQVQLLLGVCPAVVALGVGLALAPPRRRRHAVIPALLCLLVVALSLAASFLLFVIAPLALPLVLVMPTFARYARGEHVAALVVFPVALVAGALAAQRLLPSG